MLLLGGMGTKCGEDNYLSRIQHRLQDDLKVEVECYESHVFGNMNDQVKNACTHFEKYGDRMVDIVGTSQGGLLARGLIETCEKPLKVRRLLTIGTPNMGFSEIPNGGCQDFVNLMEIPKDQDRSKVLVKLGEDPQTAICNFQVATMLGLAYSDVIQNSIAAAGYYRNTNNYDEYMSGSGFLATLNNERDTEKSQ